MKLTRLRILGFKSFVEPTDFLIEPGLTGVVGPNGCGKSNLVEAMRWVMGESSYKNMRASGMDEVIFSGSATRPSRNTAEVTLTVDNAERRAPASFNDTDLLEVTRRIEREAGSAYRVNGREVRARDVQLLFADASTGAHSPAMVGQGRIGELIAAKPTARRALLEEAAGISGLHSRRHEAELRLNAAEQNLARLEDVVTEIETQLDNLKRQARQASRYRNLSGDIRKAEASALHLAWIEAEHGLGEAEAVFAETRGTVEAASDRQTGAARDQAVAAAAIQPLREAEARAGAALQRLKLAHESLDAEEGHVRQRLAEFGRRIEQLTADLAREEALRAENEGIVRGLDEEEAKLHSDEASLAERVAAAAGRLAEIADLVRESEKEHQRSAETLAALTALRSRLESTIRDAEGRRRRLAGEAATIAAERAKITAAIGEGSAVAAARSRVAELETKVAEAESGAVAAEHRATETRAAEAETRAPLAEAERTLARIEAEEAAIEKLMPRRPESGAPSVIDSVTVAAGYERALAAAFGDELDLTADDAAAAYWRLVEATAEDTALPAGVEPLTRFVTAPSVLARRLAQTGLVDRATGAALQTTLRPGQGLVSREGDHWRWDGYVATAEARSAAGEQLTNRNRLADLRKDATEAASVLAARREALDAASKSAREAEAAEREARNVWRTVQGALGSARQSLTTAEAEATRLSTRLGALDATAERIQRDDAEAEDVRSKAAESLAGTEDPAAQRAALETIRQRLAAERQSASEAEREHATLARESVQRTERLAAIAEERTRWRQRIESVTAQMATLVTRREETEKERVALSGRPDEIAEKRRALAGEIASAEKTRSEEADKLAEAEAVLSAADKAARAALEALSEAREARVRAEERVASAQARREEVSTRIATQLELAPAALVEITGFDGSAVLPDRAQIEARLERLRQERERLGGVNLRAEEEAKEVQERRDALISERDDLIEAIRRLRQGIQTLNREGRERLLAAYNTVNGHFKALFQHLFSGGTAELQLTESDDPLQAGLEIMARPPGKRPQSITLLSGGEQALTALALIFAVFLTNPAPICVLDEVDAPLDDANVERFCGMLEEMIRQTDTRFVVITHNPITMSRMNRLFGVTMGEQGVSTLVSVDLQTAERFREAG